VTTKPRILISHIHEEAPLAKLVCDLIADNFKGHGVDVSQSSERPSFPAGRTWLHVILEAVTSSKVSIVILSHISLQRPWINVELGAAWARGNNIILFCHSGLRVNDAPHPLNEFPGVDIDNDDPGGDLLGRLAGALGLVHPKIFGLARFKAEAVATETRCGHQDVATAPKPNLHDLSAQQITILQFLAKRLREGSEEVSIEEVAYGTGFTAATLRMHAQALQDRGLISVGYYSGGVGVRVMPDGLNWLLEERELKPK
jgi:TIR domain